MPHPSRVLLLVLLIASVFLAASAGCWPAPASAPPTAPTSAPTSVPPAPGGKPAYQDPSRPPEERAADLLGRMTLAEKIGQMTQVESNSIQPGDVTAYFIGSVLSGGDGQPKPNTPERWAAMVESYQQAAAKTRLAIPLIYGVDAVHGMGALKGAVIYPHAIGLGAAGDADLVERVARATAEQLVAVGIRWNFAPVVAVPQDIRWGRTYESFSEDTAVVARLGAAYVRGLQEGGGFPPLAGPSAVLATPKHYLGDGGTRYGSSKTVIIQQYLLDQGDVAVDEATLRRVHLPPYKAAVDAGAASIMVSFSSYQGTKMHGHRYLITDVLKGELGFKGFVVSDWQGIDQLPGDYHSDIVTAINAGLDMIMVPTNYKGFITELTKAVGAGEIPQARLDDAVRRILAVKFRLGCFDRPAADPSLLPRIASDAQRTLAREAVRKSLVLLKNEKQALPLRKDVGQILVAGAAADDTGIPAGGWSLGWQGAAGKDIPGTTLLAAVKQTVNPGTQVAFDASGEFKDVSTPAAACIVTVGEMPYTEGVGDRADLSLSTGDKALLDKMRGKCTLLVVVLISGRPMIVTDELAQMDALVAAWLPGTELLGVTDALFGDQPFTGKLPFTWPRAMSQLPFDLGAVPSQGAGAPLFPRGYGLSMAGR